MRNFKQRILNCCKITTKHGIKLASLNSLKLQSQQHETTSAKIKRFSTAANELQSSAICDHFHFHTKHPNIDLRRTDSNRHSTASFPVDRNLFSFDERSGDKLFRKSPTAFRLSTEKLFSVIAFTHLCPVFHHNNSIIDKISNGNSLRAINSLMKIAF